MVRNGKKIVKLVKNGKNGQKLSKLVKMLNKWRCLHTSKKRETLQTGPPQIGFFFLLIKWLTLSLHCVDSFLGAEASQNCKITLKGMPVTGFCLPLIQTLDSNSRHFSQCRRYFGEHHACPPQNCIMVGNSEYISQDCPPQL